MTWQDAMVRLIPTVVAAVAGFIAWREYRRKVREEIKSDRRREQDRWWGIVQWCIDKTDSAESAERITGWYFLPTILGLLSDVEGDSTFINTLWDFAQEFKEGELDKSAPKEERGDAS